MQEPDIEYFHLTDKSPKEPFLQYLDSLNLNHNEELTHIINNSYPIVMEHKRYYNRPRPAQVNADIKPVKSLTANTPAYPAGHTFQAYLIANHLSNKYPKHRKEFFESQNGLLMQELALDFTTLRTTKRESLWLKNTER